MFYFFLGLAILGLIGIYREIDYIERIEKNELVHDSQSEN